MQKSKKLNVNASKHSQKLQIKIITTPQGIRTEQQIIWL